VVKKLNTEGIINELKGQSVFFKKTPTSSKTTKKQRKTQKKKEKVSGDKSQTHRLTDLQTHKVTESQTYRLTDFSDYEVPPFNKLFRGELRLTWEQKKYLDELESTIARDMPERERYNPDHQRLTKNSVVRALVEIARRLELTVDASKFKNEKDLIEALAKSVTYRLTESQINEVTE